MEERSNTLFRINIINLKKKKKSLWFFIGAMVPLILPPWSGPGHRAQPIQLQMRQSQLISPSEKDSTKHKSTKPQRDTNTTQ